MAGDRRKKSKKYGGNLGYQIFHLILKLFGPTPAYFLLAFIIPYYIIFRRSASKSAGYYLKKRFPHDNKIKRFFRTIYYFYQFGLVLIDQAAIGILGREKFSIRLNQDEEIRELIKERGIVLLTSHIGNWQTAIPGIKDLKKSIYFLLQMDEHIKGKRNFELSGDNEYIKIIDPEGYMGGMVEAANLLGKSNIISVMGDRPYGWRCRSVDFLGQKADFPLTPHHLAAVTGSFLVMLTAVRTGKLSFEINILNLSRGVIDKSGLTRQDMTSIYLKQYVKNLDAFLREYPYMWFNFFDFWKQKTISVENVEDR